MTRRKVKLAFIVNNSSRKTTYKKRKRGLLKKAHEIFTLCGINAGLSFTVPTILPLRCGPPLREFFQQRITKADKLLLKKKKDNREVNLTEDMYRFLQIGQLTIPAGGHNNLL
ncbi:Agamous-like MADS-box protein AGL80 [Raphanus sativus]|nr:Agamous-like MADS-box protein AGL80 [Raphanus sativus]